MSLAIVDKNVVGEVFGNNRPEAGRKFFEWLDQGDGRLSSGGVNLDELRDHEAFRDWADAALRFDKMRLVRDQEVRAETSRLEREKARRVEGACKSNDEHVIALARIGGARLLYSRDLTLHQDFRNKRLIDDPRGQIYSTYRTREFSKSHERLLARNDLRGTPKLNGN